MRTHTNTIDLGELCKVFGGGGHKAAASFPINKKSLDDCFVEEINIEKYLKNKN
jgi:nanoRNase/pAp phosphatase (c-di-AMP/oligoRNAs hydrolase)